MGEYAVLKSFRDKYEDLAREGDIFYTGGISGCGLAGVFLQVIRVITNMDDKYSDLISECIIPGLKIHYDKIHQIIVNNRLVEDFFEITKERNFA